MIVSDDDSSSSSQDERSYLADPFAEEEEVPHEVTKDSGVPKEDTADDGTLEIIDEISFEELDLADF